MTRLITASFKQRKFVKHYLKSGSIKKAAMEAYDTSEKNAYAVGKAALSKPTTIEYMKRILDEAGMTDAAVANGLKAITEAGLSQQSLKQANPGHALKALEMTSRLRDLFPAEKKKIEKTSLTLKLQDKSPEELKEMLDKLTEEAKSFSRLLSKNVVEAEVIKNSDEINNLS